MLTGKITVVKLVEELCPRGKHSKVEGDGEVRVMTRGFGDLVAKLGDKVVMEVLVRCWSDGDVVPTSVSVIWLPFTDRNSDEAQTSEHGNVTQPNDQGMLQVKKSKEAMLAEAQEAGQILDKEQLAFLADPGIPASQAQTIIPHNVAFQTEDLDTYASDCDDLSTAQVVLIANISNYGSNIISEVPNSETYLNDMDNQSVHALQDFEQSPVMDFTDNEISSDSNIIPYSQYLQETQQATVQDTNLQAQQDSMILSMIEQMSEQMINHVHNWEMANKEQNNESITAELERYKERVKTFEQRLNIDLSCREKMIDSQMDDMIREKLALKEQIDSLEQNLSKQIKEKESVLQTLAVFKNESKEKENKYMENEIDLENKIKELDNIICKVGQSAQTVHMLTKPQVFYDNTHKQALGYQNPFYLKKAQRMKPTLYDGVVISNSHVAMHVIDDEETLILEEESRSKMFEKAKDPEVVAQKISHKPGEYDIWAMKMEHYLAHIDYPIWEVIQNGNGPVSITTDTQGQIKVLPPRIAEEILARERERKARTTLLMALLEDHLAKFHKMTDAKEMWDAIKSRFSRNDESKKMQKYILKQQFEGFSVSNLEGLHKGYDKFQILLNQLEIHRAGVSTEDANQKFLRSLPSAWSQVSLIMRTKPGVDSVSFDDLYNNLRVFENDVKGSTASPSSTKNVAFISENIISTNDVSIAYGVSNPSSHNSQYEQTSSYSLLANQSSCP
ncbi:hypothetical protein Tco_1009722 [Tanacetum coccineum]